jgi:hypothetical protein
LSFDRTCRAAALFQQDKISDVTKFTSHRPLPWHPFWQSAAEVTTVVAASLSALSLLVLLAFAMAVWFDAIARIPKSFH